VAEGARLESVFRGNSNGGSNPSLSAIFLLIYKPLHTGFQGRESKRGTTARYSPSLRLFVGYEIGLGLQNLLQN
jgi:hypothetical protein